MIQPREVISPAYRGLQVELHARPEAYGDTGARWAPAVRDLVAQFQAVSVLDYGCGEGTLKRALSALYGKHLRIDEYDPAVEGKDAWPVFADLVVSTDVLEHVEPDRLPVVLRHLKQLARKAVFAVVSTRAAERTLRDGRNAHLIVEPAEWWQAQFEAAGFTVAPGPTSLLVKPSREVSVVLT